VLELRRSRRGDDVSSTITLPTGTVVRHRCEKRYLIVIEHPDEAAWVGTSRDEYGRARSALRAWVRLYKGDDARLYLWDSETGDVTPTVVFAS
jgi:hypothetical protein